MATTTMTTTTKERYLRGQERFDEVLRAVRPEQWDLPSPCPEWTARDLAGHVIWGQDLIRAWATGAAFDNAVGAPGASRPGDYASADPVERWREARQASVAALTPDGLARVTPSRNLPNFRVEDFLEALTTDFLAHTWDLAQAVGLDVQLDPALVEHCQTWSETCEAIIRRPGIMGPALTPPPGADAQTLLLAYLGRRAWASEDAGR